MGQRRFHELVEIAIEHVVGGGACNAGAQVLDELVGLQNVGSDLVTPADIALRGGFRIGGFFALLQLGLVETGTQHVPGLRLVLVLRALLLALHHDARRHVRDAHGRIGRVDMLAAGARRTVCVDAAIALVDVDLDRIVDDGIDPDGRERRVAPGIAVERRDPHETMHARFGLEPAIGIVALDEQRRRLDAGFFAVMHFHQFDLVALAVGPAGIHAKKNVRPVLAFRAAGAGMHFQICVVAVGLAGQHGLDLAAGCFCAQDAQRVLGFLDDVGIVLFLTSFFSPT